jgi:hypothetical protein
VYLHGQHANPQINELGIRFAQEDTSILHSLINNFVLTFMEVPNTERNICMGFAFNICKGKAFLPGYPTISLSR